MTRNVVSSFRSKGLVAAAALALAGRALAQQQSTPAGAQGTSEAFERACIDLIHGKTPKGAQATATLRDACADLMKARAEERRKAQAKAQAEAQAKAQAEAQAKAAQKPGKPGVSAAPVTPGQSVAAAFGQAGGELVGQRPRGGMGMNKAGVPFSWTVTTNPIGWFTGIGVNADVAHSFLERFAWLAGASFSQTAATSRSLYELGFLGGVDWFIIGRHNEGLRLGPRFSYSLGREQSTGNETRQRLGITGELGYNFIATNGLTGEAAVGLGGIVAGDNNDELSSGVGGPFGPYVKLGLGYSW